MDPKRHRERLEDLEASPKNRRASELTAFLDALGAIRRKKGGSHHTYSHPEMDYPLVVPFHNPHDKLKVEYVKKAIQWIGELLEQRGDEP